jgi:hypothetical protein
MELPTATPLYPGLVSTSFLFHVCLPFSGRRLSKPTLRCWQSVPAYPIHLPVLGPVLGPVLLVGLLQWMRRAVVEVQQLGVVVLLAAGLELGMELRVHRRRHHRIVEAF